MNVVRRNQDAHDGIRFCPSTEVQFRFSEVILGMQDRKIFPAAIALMLRLRLF